MKLALDANVVIDLMRGDEIVRENLFGARQFRAEIVVSVMVLQELRFGSALSARPSVQEALIDRWLNAVPIIAYEIPDALMAAALQASMQRAGQTAPIGDFLIGAHAVSRGCALVTADTRHFQNIPGLKLLNWRLPPEEQEPSHG